MRKRHARTVLSDNYIPKQWYNIAADMPETHDPMLNPGTGDPIKEEDLCAIFAKELSKQELTKERYIDIPKPVREYYTMYRPAPLHRAYRLEELLDTPAKIYYKYEGGNTSGSHKLNSALAQAYYNKAEGIKKLTTETGAGQWGTALSMACSYFGLDLDVYMVKTSSQQKPYRKILMETLGGNVVESPSTTTEIGRKVLEEDPTCGGSLGTAISEAVEVALKSCDTRYALGSVLNQVLLHQSIIGLEAKEQMEYVDEYPDIVIGCAGGGSNLGGLMAGFIRDRMVLNKNVRFIAVEPEACPSLTKGRYAYDFCDAGRVTPMAKMYTLGSSFMPMSIHSGGLRYHGMSPIVSKLYHDGYIDEARALPQSEIFKAAITFARTEGLLPAPESAHAIKATIDEALKCKEEGISKTILFGLTGNGNLDLSAYAQYNAHKMDDCAPSDSELKRGFSRLPQGFTGAVK
jgi:tryptophan synthase beta chain